MGWRLQGAASRAGHPLPHLQRPQSVRSRPGVAKGMNRGGGPSTLTQLCWAWGSGPLLRRIPARPSVRAPGRSAPWRQKPRCTVGGGEAQVSKCHFPDPAALQMAVRSCHQPFAHAVPGVNMLLSGPAWEGGPAPGPLLRTGTRTGLPAEEGGAARSCGLPTHQKPVEVHEGEQQEECIEEEVEGDVGH